ncbi:MAG: hypothetical protein UR12_C0011G0001 [candidate division TM6 bacterium GW2011_GWF2_30_66]|nr:MAG: hypothetical protein UR12_C0011G0001 [candidate division TM6 bacterium GW2011_GWF2_30_66]
MLKKKSQKNTLHNKPTASAFTKNIIIFLIFILSHTFEIYSGCAACGGSTRCGSCGETQPVCCNSICNGYPFLLPRNQGRNSAREIVCTQEAQNKYGLNILNGFASLAAEYQSSFNNKQIPRYFFGQDYVNCENLYIQGSQVQNRNEKAWLADYFGLPLDYSSTISFCPKIQNVILDLNFYFGLDNLTEGLYAKVVMPIAWTKTELNPCEKICNPGIIDSAAGYLSTNTISRENLTKNFLQFISGNSTFGDMKEPLKYGLITNDKLTKIGLAELRASLGYNFVLNKDGHLGFAFLLSAPTGNKPCAKYLFEPIIGNGKHWEMGCELSGSWIFHRCKQDPDKYIGFWIDATLTHLANNCQCRSFDISCKTNSRYMLLEQMGQNLDNLKIDVTGGTDPQASTYQYQKNLVPAINWSTFKLNVEMDLQADIAIKLGIVRNNFSFDLGYDFWARTGERFAINCCCSKPPCYNMAIKGDSFIYGYYGTEKENAVALGATQSESSIHSGKNYPAVAFEENPLSNPQIDNPNPENYLTYATDSISTLAHQLTSKNNTNINTSTQPILIANGEINMDDSPSALTHKLFANFNYYYKNDDKKWLPFVGIGGEIEFATYLCKIPDCGCSNSCNNNCYLCDFCCDASCNKRMGICQWGLWLKGGLSFN